MKRVQGAQIYHTLAKLKLYCHYQQKFQVLLKKNKFIPCLLLNCYILKEWYGMASPLKMLLDFVILIHGKALYLKLRLLLN